MDVRTGNVNQIGPPPLHHLGPLHLWQIHRQTDMIVQREHKPLGVFDVIPECLGGQFLLGGFGIDRENVDVIAGLGEVAQEFVEAIGVAGDVGEGGGFDEEGYLAWWTGF